MGFPASVAAGVLLAAVALAGQVGAHEMPKAAAPRMEFTPPPAGSYALPPIQPAPAGPVIDAKGRRGELATFVTGKVTLLSLFYAQCADPLGCPLAFDTMAGLRDRLLRKQGLRDRVRLVSLSFDPAHDTPALLDAFGDHFAATKIQWSFLTGASPLAIAPILDGFGQDIAVESDGDDASPRIINHVLKLFLIDPRGMVREIYTTAFLLPEVVYNDIMTLLIEDGVAAR
ncbi:MAG: SCO family protein [Alphaproteobacteria bacterium]|nr:SCO family protein [Alphaproteobacteria bacterium]